MIVLPDWAVPRAVSPTLIDFGFMQEPALGARATRIERQGNRYAGTFDPRRARAQARRLA